MHRSLWLVVVGLGLRGPVWMAAQTPAGAGQETADTAHAVPSARPLARLVSLDLRDMPLGNVLREINRQARLGLTYTPRVVDPRRMVTIRAQRITAGDALERVLEGTDAVAVETPAHTVVLVRRPGGMGEAKPILKGSIRGRVTDSTTGLALSAVEVVLQGAGRRAVTDSSGVYRLAELDPGTFILTARRIGYAKRSRSVTVHAEGEDTLDLALSPAARPLQELVATATGRQRRRDLGNDITTIRADSVLRTAPIRNLTDLLSNRVPGLTVQRTSGAPGDPARLRLRGLGSVLRSNDPVVVVDGVRVYAAQAEPRSGNLTNLNPGIPGVPTASSNSPAPSPLDQIDPNIIETIDVFKGPSAATLYGADAANGVIVITTKKGRPGPTMWSGRLVRSRTTMPGKYATGYYRWGHDLFSNVPKFCALADYTCAPDSLITFQALNEPSLTLLGHGARTEASLSALGGTQALTYRITGTYSDEVGLLRLPALEIERFRTLFNRQVPDWMRRPQDYKYWMVSSNVTARLSRSASVSLATTLSRSEQQRSSLDKQLAALAGTYVDTLNGIYYRSAGGYAIPATSAVLEDYYTRGTASTTTVTTGLSAEWKPRTWLEAKADAGLNFVPREDEAFLPAGFKAAMDSGALTRGVGRSLVATANLQGTMRRPLGRGFFLMTRAGANLTRTTINDLLSAAAGLVPGTSSIAGAAHYAASDSRAATSVFGWFFEPQIGGERLSVSTGLRLDGGSLYGARVKLLGLPKLGASWVISEEPFFPFRTLFSSLRLRGAYGQAQVQPGPVDRLRLYSGTDDQTIALSSVGNPNVKPERSAEVEGGFDADLFDNRLSLTFSAYRKTRLDALLPVTLPGSVNGGGRVITNVGNVLNTGTEVTVSVTPLRTETVTWNNQLQYSHNRNLLTSLGQGVEPNPRAGLVAGYPIDGRWTRPIVQFADLDGDGIIQLSEVQFGDSLRYAGHVLPSETVALYTTLGLLGGALNVAAGFSYDRGGTQIDATARTNSVLFPALIDPGTPLPEQAAAVALGNDNHQSVQSVSTFRFNSLSLNYRLPAYAARLVGAQRVSVAVQASNLARHSTYSGKDPDVYNFGPSGEVGIDVGQPPLPRTWELAVSLDY